jgi:hypothetical protein
MRRRCRVVVPDGVSHRSGPPLSDSAPQMSFTSTSTWPWDARMRSAAQRPARVGWSTTSAMRCRCSVTSSRPSLDGLGPPCEVGRKRPVRLLRPVQITVAPASPSAAAIRAGAGRPATTATRPRARIREPRHLATLGGRRYPVQSACPPVTEGAKPLNHRRAEVALLREVHRDKVRNVIARGALLRGRRGRRSRSPGRRRSCQARPQRLRRKSWSWPGPRFGGHLVPLRQNSYGVSPISRNAEQAGRHRPGSARTPRGGSVVASCGPAH